MSDTNDNNKPAFPRSVNPRFVLNENIEGVDTNSFGEEQKGIPAFPKRNRPRLASDETVTVRVPAKSEPDSNTPSAPEVTSEPAPERRVVSSRFSDPVTKPSNLPPVKKDVEAKTAPAVNPRFGNIYGETNEDASDRIVLDAAPANEDEDTPRVASSRFNFKQPVAPRNKNAATQSPWAKPSALMEAEGEEAFDVKEDKPEKKTRRRRFSVTERDIVLIRFLVRYQFSYVDALARLVDSTPQTVAARLRTLESYDLVKRQRIAQGATLWSARKAGIELVGMNFVENKKDISFATIQHTIGLVNLAVELEREAGGKDILGLEKFNEPFPVFNRFPGGLRVYSEEELAKVEWQMGEMTVSEREIRQGQKRWRGGRSTAEMRDLVDLAVQSPEGPELEEGNEGLYVVYGSGGKTGEHVPDMVVQRPRQADGAPGHYAIELELTAKSPTDWKRILRSFRDAGHMYERIYYFTDKRPISNMIRIADEEVGLGSKLVIRKYTPRNKRQPFLG